MLDAEPDCFHLKMLNYVKRIEAIDLNSEMLSKAKDKMVSEEAAGRISFYNKSIDDLPFDIDGVKTLRVIDMRGILLNFEMQEELLELLPKVKLYLSPPCNCSF